MSLPKIARLPSARLLSSLNQLQHQHQQLLQPPIFPVTVPRRAVTPREYRRPGQPKDNRLPWQKINFSFSKGVEGIKKHFTLLKKEISDRWIGPEGRPILEHMLEQNRVIWEFRNPDSLKEWTVSSDQEIGGQSEVYLKLGRNDTCFLYGTLSSVPPRDGETRYSGYCTMRSKQQLVSFLRFALSTANENVKLLMVSLTVEYCETEVDRYIFFRAFILIQIISCKGGRYLYSYAVKVRILVPKF